ncbi:hypothetical protein [Desulfuromonas acetoxidans]|nr:hypothetical protein [Desulfuromonas acetoxidans]
MLHPSHPFCCGGSVIHSSRIDHYAIGSYPSRTTTSLKWRSGQIS